MILKIKNGKNNYVYLDNIYRLETYNTFKESIRGNDDFDITGWFYKDNFDVSDRCILVETNEYNLEKHGEPTVKRQYVIEKAYVLNNSGDTVDILSI